ncbi:MFS transporter [Corynebacterium appendicis]|uniref:MFS transporter n=1 Tax=Corynebacterium appendicis TaxID=163202 RepID=UPI0035CD1742
MSRDRRMGKEPANPNRWPFFVVVSLGLLMVALDNSILYTALPALDEQLGATASQSLWIINAYPLVITGLLLGSGSLGDRIGHRRMFMVGLVVFGIASLAAAFSPTVLSLVIARGVLGAGAATMLPATLALINQIFPHERERNLAMSIWVSAAVLGAALGPVVGGALLHFFWWGSVFLINVPVVVLAIVCTLLIGPRNTPNPDKHWDLISSIFALFTLSGLTLTIEEAARLDTHMPVLIGAAVVMVFGAVMFGRRQKKLDEPLLTFDIFKNPVFTGGAVSAAGAMFVLVGLEMTSTQRLQLVDGFSPFHAGLTIGVIGFVALPFTIAGGALLHRIGFQTIVSGGFAACIAGALICWWGSAIDNFPTFLAGGILLGAGANFAMSVSSTAIIGAAPPERAGMAGGVEEVSYEFGTLVTVAISGSMLTSLLLAFLPPGIAHMGMNAIYDPATHDAAATAYAHAHELTIVFLAATAVVFCAITAWCFRGNPKSPNATVN